MSYKVLSMLMLCGLAWSLWGCAGEETSATTGETSSTSTTTTSTTTTCTTNTCSAGELPLEGGGCQKAGLPADMPCQPGELPLEGGGCQAAGLPDMPCPPGELPLEGGGCQPAGIPSGECGEGFVHDGKRGCLAVLPEQPCPAGQMAVPGETQCHDVAPCGASPWGNIPVEATTQFVDGSYPGADSDGTQEKPWKTIQKGIDSAKNGAIVAVATGLYEEDVRIQGKAVRLWGRCPSGPERAEVVGVAGGHLGTIEVLQAAASGSEIRGLGITGDGVGIAVVGSLDVSVDKVWVHDSTDPGIIMKDEFGPTRAMVKASLIESASEIGVAVIGSDATIEATVVRGILPNYNGEFGRGIEVQYDPEEGKRSDVKIRSSLVEDNHDVGVFLGGSDGVVEATVMRATLPNNDGGGGQGITISYAWGERSNVELRGCLVEDNRSSGVYVAGSDAVIEATVVRATLPDGNGADGLGIQIRQDFYAAGEPSRVQLRSSLIKDNRTTGVTMTDSEATIEATVIENNQKAGVAIFSSEVTIKATAIENNYDQGVFISGSTATIEATAIENNYYLGVSISGSTATIEATVVRATLRDESTGGGWGLHIHPDEDTGDGSHVQLRSSLIEDNDYVGAEVRDSFLQLRGSLIENNHEAGIYMAGSEAEIESTVVRATQSDDSGSFGLGLVIQDNPETMRRSHVVVRGSLFENNRDLGVLVQASEATIESTVICATELDDNGLFGRGIHIQENDAGEPSQVEIHSSVIEDNHDVGVMVLNSQVTIEATVVHATETDTNGGGGEGIVALSSDSGRASATIVGSRIESNARAGISLFSADVKICSSIIVCNVFDINKEVLIEDQDNALEVEDSLCGCEDPSPICRVSSAGLAPPAQIDPLGPEP